MVRQARNVPTVPIPTIVPAKNIQEVGSLGPCFVRLREHKHAHVYQDEYKN